MSDRHPMETIEFLKDFDKAANKLDVRKFKAESLLEQLANKKVRNEDEELIFQVMYYLKMTYAEMENHIKERCLELKIPGIEDFKTKVEYYDWDSEPIKMWEWSFKSTYFDKHVGEDVINGWRISTVWLGLDHGFFKKFGPIIFETMIFKEDEALPDNEFCEHYQERYSYLHEAIEGHKKACDGVKYLDVILEHLNDN